MTGLIPAANTNELENICIDKCAAAIVFPDELVALKTSPADKDAIINYEIRMRNFTTNKLVPEPTPRLCNGDWNNDFVILGPNESNEMGF